MGEESGEESLDEVGVRYLHEAVRVEQQVGRLDVSVQQIGRVHEFEGLEQLPHDVLLVDVLQDVGADRGVQVRLHVLKCEVKVAVVIGLEHALDGDDVLMWLHCLEELREESGRGGEGAAVRRRAVRTRG